MQHLNTSAKDRLYKFTDAVHTLQHLLTKVQALYTSEIHCHKQCWVSLVAMPGLIVAQGKADLVMDSD